MMFRRFAASLAFATCFVLASVPPPSLTASHHRFADELTTALFTPDSNQCSSSWGVSMALSLVYPGANEPTADQMRTVLGYPDGSNLQLVWYDTANRLDVANSGQCQWGEDLNGDACGQENPNVEIANSVWIDDGDELFPAYGAIVGDFAKQMDFASQEAGSEINSWVEEKTSGLIDSIINDGPIRPDVFLIAVNSIYLKASWANPFSESFTNTDTFYSTVDQSIALESQAHFMHSVDYFEYSSDALPGSQILQLPFNGDSLSMVFVLPRNTEAGMATSVGVISALSDLKQTRVAVGIPKYKFESRYESDLKASLISIGLSIPFGGGLDALVVGKNGQITDIIQKTVIDVHEKGVEAAAATMVMVGESAGPMNEPDPILFMANHPFQFFIYDKTEDIVLFEGRVVYPGVDSSAPGAPLEAKHSDIDFWESQFDVTPEVLHPQSTIQDDSSSGRTVVAQHLFLFLFAFALSGLVAI